MTGDRRDPEFCKMLDRVQEEFRQFLEARMALSDPDVLKEYVD